MIDIEWAFVRLFPVQSLLQAGVPTLAMWRLTEWTSYGETENTAQEIHQLWFARESDW